MNDHRHEKKPLFSGFFRKAILILAILAVAAIVISGLEHKSAKNKQEKNERSAMSAVQDASSDHRKQPAYAAPASSPAPQAAMPEEAPLVTVLIDPATTTGRFERALLGSNILWTDNGCGLIDNNGRFRNDIVSLLKEMGVPLLRYPGGLISSTYIWQNGIGPQESRGESLAVGNYPQTIHMGTEEYLTLLGKLDSRGLITLSSDIDPEQAVEWLQYVNKAPNGSRVDYWEFGNESFIPADPSYTTAAKYITSFNKVAAELKKIDPAIRIGAILEASLIDVAHGIKEIPEIATWNDDVISATKDKADFYALHPYAPHAVTFTGERVLTRKEGAAGAQISMIAPVQVEKNIKSIKEKLEKQAVTADLLVTEFNLLFYAPTDLMQYLPSLTQANYVMQNLMIFARQGIKAANFYSLLNDYMFGQVTTGGGTPELRPVGHIYEILKPWADAELVKVSTQRPLPVLPYEARGTVTNSVQPELLDLTVLKKPGQGMALVAINRSIDLGAYLKLQFAGNADRPMPIIENIYYLYAGEADLFAPGNTLSGAKEDGTVRSLPEYQGKLQDNERIVPLSPANIAIITFK